MIRIPAVSIDVPAGTPRQSHLVRDLLVGGFVAAGVFAALIGFNPHWFRGGSAMVYGSQQTEACLKGQSLTVSRKDADYEAQRAINGGYVVNVGQTRATLYFYRTSGDADGHLASAKLLVKAFGAKVSKNDPELYTKSNTMVAWDDMPTSAEKSTVEGCLTAG